MLRPRSLTAAAAAALLLVLGACSSDDDDDARASDDTVADADREATDADAGSDDSEVDDEAAASTGGGTATITIGSDTWEFEDVRCAFGEENIGVEGAVMNLSAIDGSISLYVNVEPDFTYVELTDLETMDQPDGLYFTTMGMDAPEPDIGIDGRSVSADVGMFSIDDESGGQVGPVPASVSAECP